VLLIDEVMAVGDLAFQRKSYEWFEKNTNNKTIVVVSHSLAQIARICNKTIVLDKGEQCFMGKHQKELLFMKIWLELKYNQNFSSWQQ
jgi:ABC-2 type transport system ATP-binding protein